MVAETLPVAPETRKRMGFRPTFPLQLKLKVRSLYVIQQLSSAEIGAQVGLTRKQVQDLVKREGWIAVKRRAKASILAKHDARAREEVLEVHEAFALKTEELGMGVLEKAGARMPDQDENVARDLQALSQTAKNFIGIARQVRGMDLSRDADRNGQTLVFVKLERVGDASTAKRLPEPAATEINVTPVLNNSAPDSPKLT